MHQRRIIREAIEAALMDETIAGSDVYRNRLLPFRLKELPAIDIASSADDIKSGSVSTAPRELESSYTVEVRGWLSVSECADDEMDEIAEDIEAIMNSDPYFGGACADSYLSSTTFDLQPQGETDCAVVTLAYRFKYYTNAPVAPTGLDDFSTVHATHNLGSEVHEDDAAEDSITVQEPEP